ncbi:MAG: HAMP domain-containing sensor histidine kinase [Phycisphaerae bacterium]|nr:HAMP domain-containing sensor histidine kinase [Phycisphaerae bacterium]
MTQIIAKRRSLNKEINLQLQANKELQARFAKLQTLANLGTISAIVAHEINNILMPLGNYAQVALNNPQDTQLAKKALEKTVYNSARASEILEGIIAVVNGEALEKKICRLKQLVDEVFACIGRDFEKDRLKVAIDIPETMDINVVPVQFQQVLMNLILNAREAMMPRGGTLTINARKEQDKIIIEISDTGCGIEPDNMEKIFSPFFSTKTLDSPAGRVGAGLGLLFCKETVDSHNGTIDVQSAPDKGTKFTITLPAD